MGYLRIFRRVHVAPGVTINIAKTGPSLSCGVRGAHFTASRTGIRKTAGLPGSGCYYTSKQGWHSGVHTAPHFANTTPAAPVQRSGWQAVGHVLLVVIEGVGIALVGIAGILAILGDTGGKRR
ncbi:MAG: DUF4236 domain-containing protein [Acidobacteriaceae bacterium]